MTLFKNSKMTYQLINKLERFNNLNQDIVNNIMNFINPSIKTYKEMFNETIEYINYFVYFDVGYVEIKENKKDKLLLQVFVEFKFEKYEEDNGLFYYYLTSVDTLYFNKKRENISMGFIKLILNFEIDGYEYMLV